MLLFMRYISLFACSIQSVVEILPNRHLARRVSFQMLSEQSNDMPDTCIQVTDGATGRSKWRACEGDWLEILKIDPRGPAENKKTRRLQLQLHVPKSRHWALYSAIGIVPVPGIVPVKSLDTDSALDSAGPALSRNIQNLNSARPALLRPYSQ